MRESADNEALAQIGFRRHEILTMRILRHTAEHEDNVYDVH